MQTLSIDVTAQNIREGYQNSCRSCPIALAVQRATSRCVNVSNREVGFFLAGHVAQTVDLPKRARDFIAAYDRGDPVEPFSFQLPLPAVAEAA